MSKFTIAEVKKYILSKDSLVEVLDNLTEENIIKANAEDPLTKYKEWLRNTFYAITENERNGETMEDIQFVSEKNKITISFTVDADRYGSHHDNTITILKKNGYSDINIRLCELIEGCGVEEELKMMIERNIKELLDLF